MQVSTALLCDAASVRDNLLFILGGGVTRMYRDDLPAPMSVNLALTINLHRMELDRPHELAVDVITNDGVTVVEVRGGFQAGPPPGMEVHEELIVPVVLPFTGAVLPQYGWYSIEISINGQHHRTIPFRLTTRAEFEASRQIPPATPQG